MCHAESAESRKYHFLYKTTNLIGKELATGMTSRFNLNDPRWSTGELSHVNKGKITVRDKDGNCFHVSKDDPRWETGEITHVTKGLVLTCPHCGKTGGNAMKRWHFDNCKRA